MQRTLWLTLALLLGGMPGLAADDDHPAPRVIDDVRFDFLRNLEGIWFGQADSGEMPEGRYEFRVTAGGTAIEEREMIGTPMEMMTVYHMDRGQLVATHYCMIGNQPHLTAAPGLVNDTLSFACNGIPGNEKSHDAHHVHAWSMQLRDDGTLYYSAELTEDGKVTQTPSVVLVRQQETASR
jgi:hypothetical protein